MKEIIAIINPKGGVSKTTTVQVLCLAILLSYLFWDGEVFSFSTVLCIVFLLNAVFSYIFLYEPFISKICVFSFALTVLKK